MIEAMGMKIKCIIFDLGDVIVNLDFTRFFKDVINPSPFNKPSAPIYLEFFRQSDTYHQGKITDEIFYQQACELLGICSLDQKDFFNAFNSIISDLNQETVNLIENIKKHNNLKIMVMSNINASHWKYLKKQKWNIWNLIDEFILSHEVHITKPDMKIFKYAIEKARCKPKQIIFIDDGLNNVRAANELGINGIKFDDVKSLIEKLRQFNIKIDIQ
jgi:epoxide hydrolase-like predicted phosphatase